MYLFLYIINLIIQLFVLYSLSIDYSEYSGLLKIFVAFTALSFIGTAYFFVRKKPLAIIGIIGSIVYIPIGLIGVLSLKKVLDEENKKEFYQQLNND